MPRVKVPRKSTNIDMTAMCDVAFLLLSFFILATKFKPPEALSVVTPKSVSTATVKQNDAVTIVMDKDAKVYFEVSDNATEEKGEIIDQVNTLKNLGLNDAEKKAFQRGGSYIGVPFSQVKAWLDVPQEQLKNFKAPGIPVTDTLNNELTVWMRAAASAFQGKKMNLLLKGDNASLYPSFKGVIDAFKKNDIFKFSMITNPVAVPEGTELFQKKKDLGGKATDQ